MSPRDPNSRKTTYGNTDERGSPSGTDENIRRQQRADVAELRRRGGVEESGIGHDPVEESSPDRARGERSAVDTGPDSRTGGGPI